MNSCACNSICHQKRQVEELATGRCHCRLRGVIACSIPDPAAEGFLGYFPVVRHGERGHAAWFDQNHVAATPFPLAPQLIFR